MDILTDFETIGSAVAGLVLGGAMLRQFLLAWAEGRSKLKGSVSPGTTSAMVTGITIGWSADQIERVVQALENIAQAASYYRDTDREEARTTLERTNALLDQLARAEHDQKKKG